MAYNIRVKLWEPDRRQGHNRVIATAVLSDSTDETWRAALATATRGVPGHAGGVRLHYEVDSGGDRVVISCSSSIVDSIKDAFEKFLIPQINQRARVQASLAVARDMRPTAARA
jgi:hypothetical protein